MFFFCGMVVIFKVYYFVFHNLSFGLNWSMHEFLYFVRGKKSMVLMQNVIPGSFVCCLVLSSYADRHTSYSTIC